MEIKKLKKIFIFLFFLLGTLFISNISEASSGLELKNLNYDIRLNADGSMDITETWKIKIEDTNTLFKTFELDSSAYKGFTNVEVYEIDSNGNKIEFNRINEEMYHVTKGSYYALTNSKGKYEIAWGVSVKNKTKTYEIKYRVLDCIKTYKDCSEVYWKLISTDSSIPADKVTGTIKLPQKVLSINDLRAWAHGPLNGNISIDSKDTVSFEVEYLDANTLLEVRIVTLDTSIFTGATQINKSKIDSILSEEQELADKANKQREEYQKQLEKREKGKKLISIGINAVTIILIIVCIFKVIKYSKLIKNTKKLYPTQKLDYYREIPNEKMSPAEASVLYYFEKNNFSANISKVLSATILNLGLKKYIAFSTDNRKNKEDIRISIMEDVNNVDNKQDITEDEKTIFKLLVKVPKSGEKSFTMKEFEEYAKKNCKSFLNQINSVEDKAKKELENEGYYSKELISKSNNCSAKSSTYFSFIFVSIIVGINLIAITGFNIITNILFMSLIALLIANLILCNILKKKFRVLTQKGIDEAEKWKALKRYMEDFSLLNEREVPELVLWEKYLVFATAFGIADKVLKQLKIKYPELSNINENSMYSTYTYMHLMYHSSLNTAFVSSLDKSVLKAYQTGVSQRARESGYSGGNYSSGGGHGGGFSGGGHGGGHGGGSMGGR